MKLYPHVIQETTERYAAQKWLFPDTFAATLPAFNRLLQQAVVFDFGEQAPAHEHIHFALEMYERGLFTLPFPVTAFSVMRRSGASLGPDGRQAVLPGLIILSMGDPTGPGMTCTVCSPTQDQHGRINGGIPATMGFKVQVRDRDAGAATVEVEAYPIITHEAMRRMFGDQDVMTHRVCEAFVNAMGMTVMMMSKGVETVHSPAPDRLNRKRAQKGRPPIGESYTVRIMPEFVRRIALDDGSETDITGYTRKSPRPHWRRGHFRTLPSGSVIPVLPAIVGLNDNPVQKPSYELRGSQQVVGA